MPLRGAGGDRIAAGGGNETILPRDGLWNRLEAELGFEAFPVVLW